MRAPAAVVLLVLTPLALGAVRAPPAAPPRLLDVRVSNGAAPFAGDRRLLATVSPNGDGFRDGAIVSFRLDRAARLTMEAVRTETIRENRAPSAVVWHRSWTLGAGAHRLAWRPARTTPPRTYVLRLTVRDSAGRARVYGNYRPWRGEPVDAPVVRVQGIELGFLRRSYAPGELAALTIATDARAFRLQVFAFGNSVDVSNVDVKTNGGAVTPPLDVRWDRYRSTRSRLRLVRAGEWTSGLYFLRARAADGRTGYAPFILRPRTLGTSRIAVVLATNTWQAYNFDDANGDGWGDSWYVSGAQRSVGLQRPFLDFGVPFRFHDWDLEFISWLNRTGKQVDYLSDDDLERVGSGDALARAYDLVVFPGHEEYVTRHVYDVVRRYRDLGGNLAFLAANNFFREVTRRGERIVRGRLWRDLGRPEAGLVGVQYVGSNHGERQAPFVVTGTASAPWAFGGTGLADGSGFGRYGIEIDARTPATPPGTILLARIPDVLGPGRTAEMTYYENAAGAKVFAAGALNFAASLNDPQVARLVENVWARLSKP
ncbi:MAG: hypothetical protein QOF50_691 [Gaiellaceae bacterium]|jgi:hypothetical protein|nr:hypothetical protein [Gaiellaceae bacterium]